MSSAARCPASAPCSATLGDDRRARAPRPGVRPPSVTVVGPVAALAERARLARGAARCTAARVAVTRARAQASGPRRAAARARRRGASRRPRSGSSPLPGPAPDLDALRPRLPDEPERRARCCSSASPPPAATRARSPARPSPRSGRARRGRCASTACVADVVPERFVAEGLVEALRGVPVTRALVARAAEARDVLARRPARARRRGRRARALRDRRRAARSTPRARRCARADYVTFTSSSTVRFFLARGRRRPRRSTARGSSRSAR